MRKTYRWIGCAAVLCFTAVELSGCSSKPLISGFKLPGRKDSDTAIAKKDKQPNAEETSDLLAQAREYEKAGDFPKAAKAYREYLNGGGDPVAPDRSLPAQQVAKSEKSEKKSLDRTASADAPRSKSVAENSPKPSVRPAAKTKKTASQKATTAKASEAVIDPWAQQGEESDKSNALPEIRPNVRVNRSSELASQSSSEDHVAALEEKPDWANGEAESPLDAPEAAEALTNESQARRGLTQSDLDDLLDLDEGEIDWGDEPKHAENSVAAEEDASVADDVPSSPPEPDLPLVDLNEEEPEGMAPPIADETVSRFADRADDPWRAHEVVEVPEATEELASVDSEETSIATDTDSEFAPPVFSDSEPATEEGESLALVCKDCEPWVYAQAMKLESDDPETRKEGLKNLADMGSSARKAGLAVRSLLRDSEPLVQAHAAWALWEIENDPLESVGTLRPLLDHSNAEVVELACYMLGDIGAQADSGIDSLQLLRDHADGSIQIHAAEALIRIRGVEDKSIQVLTKALKSKDSEERWIAAVALGRCRGDKSGVVVSSLTAALKDVDPEVRSAAALSLGGLGRDALKAAPELERVARSDDSHVRDAARAALACLKR